MVRRKGGRTCILDFGIARETGDSDLTEAGLIVGSPQYMSHEQLSGGHVTARSDVYTLGLVLFEMLTGVSPFRVPGASTATLRALREIPPDPRRHQPALPGFVAEAILRALCPRPEQRFATPMELAEALVPVRDEHAAGDAAEDSDLAIPIAPRVLLGLPDGSLRQELDGRLARMGLDVTTSPDGRAALDASYGGEFALVVLGASLPGVDGLTACQLMRRNPRCGSARFVLVLDGPDPGREAFARQVGASDVLHLPLNVHAFTRKVRELLIG
jgi:serine/threonine-protein kinase